MRYNIIMFSARHLNWLLDAGPEPVLSIDSDREVRVL